METTIIQFEKTIQVSEDSWRVIRKTLKVNQDTTIHEIRRWSIAENGGKEPEQLFMMTAAGL